ncbi:MAG: hypothetical protein ISS78_03190 [Phycisphaerae bacterium]|nr:hypothetical protein [Phycisphaerae bacterium]
MRRPILPVVLVSLSVVSSPSHAAQAVELGKRYIDPAHGFSLRPPLDTVRRRGFSTARLVSWSRQEAKTGAILWTLSVRQVTTKDKQADLKKYSRELETRLTREKKFRVESVRIVPLAGKGAIDVKGITAGPIRLWERQVWILPEPGRFLIFAMAGPTDASKRLDKICSQILATVTLTDPKAAREQLAQNLARGRELLASLNDNKLSKAVTKEPQWFLLTHKGKDVGFMHVAESWGRLERMEGVTVKTCVMLQMPKDKRRVLRRSLFSTARGNFERWREHLLVGGGPAAVGTTEEGLKKADMIVCGITRGGNSSTRKKKVPKSIYLPRAIGWQMFRLVDLTKPARYAFASYASLENNFDMRTFAVIGTEKIATVRGEVQAVRATDQAAANTEPATLWLSPDGKLLRMKSADGLVMNASARGAVLRRYPKAKAVVSAPTGHKK